MKTKRETLETGIFAKTVREELKSIYPWVGPDDNIIPALVSTLRDRKAICYIVVKNGEIVGKNLIIGNAFRLTQKEYPINIVPLPENSSYQVRNKKILVSENADCVIYS